VSVFTIRAHKRFAVCRKVRLHQPDRRGVDALLIELSLDGCRLSHAGALPRLAPGDPLVLSLPGTEALPGCVRWAREGTLGLRFDQPLHTAALEALIGLCRETEPARVYGT
jgi:hypothetical protein